MIEKTDKQRINELMGYFRASKTPLMLRDKLKETLKEVRENERQTLFSKKTVNMALDGVEGTLKTIQNLESENAGLRKELKIRKETLNKIHVELGRMVHWEAEP